MPKFLFSFLLLGIPLFMSAQALVPIQKQLNFPNTNELQASALDLDLFNPNSYPITIDEVVLFEFYGNKTFSLSDTSFTVAAGDTFNLSVDFNPEHNLLHDQVLILKSNSGFGHTLVELNGQGIYSKSYYSSTRNLEQEALKTALSSRISQGYTSLGYTSARDNMYATIDNNGGSVECVYTGRTASFNTRAGANNNNFNCEHTFPQGFFSSNEPMRSDIHHLFPTDVSANSTRGNKPFGVVSSPNWQNGGSKSSSSTFEPRNGHKGAVARAMMYFVMRYQDYSNHFAPQENILRTWHDQYPPSTAEQNRNDDIFAVQNNRNPFVDYPQFIERISDIIGMAQSTDAFGLYYSDDTIFLAEGNSGSRRYNFIIYGEGSLGGGATNFSLSDPNLSFAGGNPGVVSLMGGDYQEIEIEFETGTNYSATLSFDAFGLTVNIPIVSGPQLSTAKIPLEELPKFFPNPSQGIIQVANFKLLESLNLIHANGHIEALEISPRLNLSDHAKGLYILQYTLKNQQRFQQKLILD